MENNKTHFGFKEVNISQKANLVGQIFSNVAQKYDLMNDVMSIGTHRLWKNSMIKHLDFFDNMKIIDVAGGTGDIAFKIAKIANEKSLNYQIDLVDINPQMLEVGKSRAIDKNLFNNLKFTVADGENLPFVDETFDYFTIAFGIRNFTNVEKGVEEAFRVLKKGGKFICLEFSKVEDLLLQKIYDNYSFKIIPKMGEFILKDGESYQYLVESIRKFPDQKTFKKIIEKQGFSDVKYQNLTFGVCAIHYAIK
ncbi:MAG: bifunctional demethylmenaquinone methyltransferase/2-methoxy-6-polyprenyl-1,4-benzoquinol methylase UbiE [Rickettsiales bacterium]